jgi:hypothetical protein
MTEVPKWPKHKALTINKGVCVDYEAVLLNFSRYMPWVILRYLHHCLALRTSRVDSRVMLHAYMYRDSQCERESNLVIRMSVSLIPFTEEG